MNLPYTKDERVIKGQETPFKKLKIIYAIAFGDRLMQIPDTDVKISPRAIVNLLPNLERKIFIIRNWGNKKISINVSIISELS